MKFSIIIPLYNNEKYIDECLQSVLSQTYNNFEIIVINDGSTDDSLSKIERFVDNRIKIFTIQNHGIAYVRNLGIKKSTGDYILFLDSDDYYSCDFLANLNTLIEEKKSDLIISKCNILNNVKLRHYLYDCEFDKEIIDCFDKESILQHILKIKMINVVWRYAIKRKILIEKKLYFSEDLLKHEDEEWTVKLLCCCDTFSFFDMKYYTYRVREKSLMTNRQIVDLKYYLQVVKRLLDFAQIQEMKKYKKYILSNCKRLLKYSMKQVLRELGENRHRNKKIILVGMGKAGYLHYSSYLKINKLKKEDIILVDTKENNEFFVDFEHFYDIKSAMEHYYLDSKDVILDVCTPKDCFRTIIKQGIELGIKNYIVEKPCMFSDVELRNFKDINFMMIQNYMYSKITKRLKQIITTCNANLVEIETNFSKDRVADSKNYRGGTNNRNVTVFEVEMPHQIYITDFLLNKNTIAKNKLIKTKDFYKGDAHAYGCVIDNYNDIKITHLSNLCDNKTTKRIYIRFDNGIEIYANYLIYDKNLNKENNGTIDIYFEKRLLFTEIFENDDNMFENINYIYNEFNSNNNINNIDNIILNSSQIAHYKELINYR